MIEFKRDTFVSLVSTQIALRGLTTHSLAFGIPDKHKIHLATTLPHVDPKTQKARTRLYEITFEVSDFNIFEDPLGTGITYVGESGTLDEQVECLWQTWTMDQWKRGDPVAIFHKSVGGSTCHINSKSLCVMNLLYSFFGQLADRSITCQDRRNGVPESLYYRTAAIRLNAYLLRQQREWKKVFEQLIPLSE